MGSCGHFFRYKEVAAQYFAHFSETDALFVEMYPFIVHDIWGGQPQTDFGSAEHMKLVWGMAKHAPIFTGR
jgi:hypothetical protein